MRIFSAGLDSENNTFSNLLTGWPSFQEGGGIWRGNAGSADNWLGPVPKTFARLAAERGFDYVEGLYAAAQPAGPVIREVYESLRDEILQDIKGRGPFEIVLLHLEGAMVAQGYDDCEGDVLERVRALLPNGIVGVVLDPHCHLTQQMVDNADFLVACKLFPHDDYADRAADLFHLCARAAAGEIRPKAAVFDCKMIGIYPTTEEPMSSFVGRQIAAEKLPGILSVSFIHGFPYGDTPDTGSKMLVYANGDANTAHDCARRLGLDVYAARERLLPHYPEMDEALSRALDGAGPVVLADVADNAGGGAPGDNVAILIEMLKRNITNAAFASVCDPQVATLCAEACVGAAVTVRLGGKTNVSSGASVDIRGTVRGVAENHWQTSIGETRQPMGRSVWIETEGIDVVVCTVRSQVFAPDLFTGLGVNLETKQIIVVKSVNHFYSRFAPIASRIIHVATPGALSLDFANIDYQKRSPYYFPRFNDPLGVSSEASSSAD
jgi:microcystin degradation protein MlrC